VWPNANAGTTVQGQCIQANGWQGIAVRTCSVTAVWGAVTTPCAPVLPPCPAIVGFNASTNWPSTSPGSTATGSCVVGKTAPPSGLPQRQCLATGLWSNVVTNDCIVGTSAASPGRAGRWVVSDKDGWWAWAGAHTATGGAGQSRVESVTVSDVLANKVTLSWTANPTADRYQLLLTSDDGASFQVVPAPPGYAYINLTTHIVQGLAENTVYFFRLTAGDALGYDTNPFVPAPNATTRIAGTFLRRRVGWMAVLMMLTWECEHSTDVQCGANGHHERLDHDQLVGGLIADCVVPGVRPPPGQLARPGPRQLYAAAKLERHVVPRGQPSLGLFLHVPGAGHLG
jgi:hypothetical protein